MTVAENGAFFGTLMLYLLTIAAVKVDRGIAVFDNAKPRDPRVL